MNRKDIVIGLVILASLVAGVMLLRRNSPRPLEETNNNQNTMSSTESQIESSFKVDIPEDVEKAELKDVANVGGVGLVTRKFENNTFTATVLADLPDPTSGTFYQVWISNDGLNDENAAFTSLGRMKVAKGGWLLEYQGKVDYSEVKNVMITQEEVSDAKPEKHILEGSF